MEPSPQSYLIIGAGAFGASTALHLIRAHPTAQITLLDRTAYPSPYAAAHDLNKIIRADYDDKFYLQLALEAQRYWREDPLFAPYYHETGMLLCEDFGMCVKAEGHYKALGVDVPAEWITPDEIRTRFGGVLKGMDLSGVERGFWNPTSGWGVADKALENVVRCAIDLGVTYVTARVRKLTFDAEQGTCVGVQTEHGREYGADRVVVCAGPWTAKLFADSAPQNEKLQVNGRMVAAAAVMATVRIPAERAEEFKHAPVLFNDKIHGKAPSLSPLPQSRLRA